MSRRLTKLFVIWFALLTVIAPAVTCAAAVQKGDCCPAEAPAPCGECPDQRLPSTPSQAHCMAPTVQVVAATAVSQLAAEQTTHPDAPDVVAASDSISRATSYQGEPAGRPEPPASSASRAAFTYLVTGRLRL